jgi:hypothetical protein
MFRSVKHVEIAFNRLSDPGDAIQFPVTMETLILESNAITSVRILDFLNAPRYFFVWLLLTKSAKVVSRGERSERGITRRPT